ncbi:MAG TPA: peptidase M19, partial [Candidatus Bathyarchaeota archaeon]|nr:peptidase M19 [Candidatus Bathyarchaeota archaeon]
MIFEGGMRREVRYRAYRYLEPEVDYRVFRLRGWFRPEWSYKVPLSRAEEERVEELLERCIVIDLHEHPFLFP